MTKRRGLRAILLLPLATILFVLGWTMYKVKTKPNHAKRVATAEKTAEQDFQFVMIDEDQHMLETYA